MGVSISWKPTDPRQGTYVDGGSSFHKALENAFGGFPMTLTERDIGKLQGIAACGHEEGASELIEAIFDYASIEVSAEW